MNRDGCISALGFLIVVAMSLVGASFVVYLLWRLGRGILAGRWEG